MRIYYFRKIKAWAMIKLTVLMSWMKNAWSYMRLDNLAALLLFLIGVSGYTEWITTFPRGYIIVDLRVELIGIGIGFYNCQCR